MDPIILVSWVGRGILLSRNDCSIVNLINLRLVFVTDHVVLWTFSILFYFVTRHTNLLRWQRGTYNHKPNVNQGTSIPHNILYSYEKGLGKTWFWIIMDVWGHSIYWTVLYLYRYIPQNMNTPVFFTMGSTVLVPVYLYISPYITYVLYYTLHCVRTGVCGVLLCVLLCGHANTRVVTRTQCMEYFLC